MTSLAGIRYVIKHDDSIILEGPSFRIFPTSATTDSIQWHLVPRKDDDDLEEFLKDFPKRPPAAHLGSYEHKKAFLGFCRKAEIHVGTITSNSQKINYSTAKIESTHQYIGQTFTVAINAGFSKYINAGISASGTVQSVKGQAEKSMSSSSIADNSALSTRVDRPLLFYDVQSYRGWLVPELSAILFLSHAFIRHNIRFRPEEQAKPLLDSLQQTNAEILGNGGKAAYDAIIRGEKVVLWLAKEGHPIYFRDLVEYILNCIDARRDSVHDTKKRLVGFWDRNRGCAAGKRQILLKRSRYIT
jgi:hypothetical protein